MTDEERGPAGVRQVADTVRSVHARPPGALRADVGTAARPRRPAAPSAGVPRTVAVVRGRGLGAPDVPPPGADVPDSSRPRRAHALYHLRHHLHAAGELEFR